MKKYLVFLFAAMTLFVVSCSDNGTNPVVPGSPDNALLPLIEGHKWTYYFYNTDGEYQYEYSYKCDSKYITPTFKVYKVGVGILDFLSWYYAGDILYCYNDRDSSSTSFDLKDAILQEDGITYLFKNRFFFYGVYSHKHENYNVFEGGNFYFEKDMGIVKFESYETYSNSSDKLFAGTYNLITY